MWFGGLTLAPGLPLSPSGRPIDSGFRTASERYKLFKPMMFFRAAEQTVYTNAGPTVYTNAGLRRYDQTWRLRELPDRTSYRDEVILVARTPMLADLSESATTHPASPSRLWIGELPGGDTTRPTVPGIMTQETFLRVYIPVAR